MFGGRIIQNPMYASQFLNRAHILTPFEIKNSASASHEWHRIMQKVFGLFNASMSSELFSKACCSTESQRPSDVFIVRFLLETKREQKSSQVIYVPAEQTSRLWAAVRY